MRVQGGARGASQDRRPSNYQIMSSATPIEPSGLDQDRPSLDDGGSSRLYRTTAQDLVVFFARRTYDAEAAADLMAETFAKAYLGRGVSGARPRKRRGHGCSASPDGASRCTSGAARPSGEHSAGWDSNAPSWSRGSAGGSRSWRASTRCEARWPSIWAGWLRRNARRSSCESYESFPTRCGGTGSASASRRPERVCRAHCERWEWRSTAWQQPRGDQDA